MGEVVNWEGWELTLGNIKPEDFQHLHRLMAKEADMVNDTIPQRLLGGTEREVSILGLGGGGLLMRTKDKDAAAELVNRAIDLGINYIDTSPSYGDSELHIGEVMKSRRNEVFLATKIHRRGYDEGWQKIENSLKRLQTDHIDLIQVHDIIDMQSVDDALKPDGSLSAMLDARTQGVVRWIGVTGHYDPDAILYALERFDFDTVLIPVNISDRHYRSFISGVMPVAAERRIGVIGMKVFFAGGVIEELGVTPEETLRYALSYPISTAVVGMDSIAQLEQNVSITRSFTPMTREEASEIEARTRTHPLAGNEKFKKEPVERL